MPAISCPMCNNKEIDYNPCATIDGVMQPEFVCTNNECNLVWTDFGGERIRDLVQARHHLLSELDIANKALIDSTRMRERMQVEIDALKQYRDSTMLLIQQTKELWKSRT